MPRLPFASHVEHVGRHNWAALSTIYVRLKSSAVKGARYLSLEGNQLG